jgi:hypothetical protein
MTLTIDPPIAPPTLRDLKGVLKELRIDPIPQNVSMPETKKKLMLTSKEYNLNQIRRDLASAVEATMSEEFLLEMSGERRFLASSSGVPDAIIEALEEKESKGLPGPVLFQINHPNNTWIPIASERQWRRLDDSERGMAYLSALPEINNREPLIVLLERTGRWVAIHGSSGSTYPAGRPAKAVYWKEEQQ